jgi:hypothetical protein
MSEHLHNLFIIHPQSPEFSNAFLFDRRIYTAHHTTDKQKPSVLYHPATQERLVMPFEQPNSLYDIDISLLELPATGFLHLATPEIGLEVSSIGYRRPTQSSYKIEGIIVDFTNTGEVIVERKHNTPLFQDGMSGSVLLADQQTVIGRLARSGDNKRGNIAIFTPLHVLR